MFLFSTKLQRMLSKKGQDVREIQTSTKLQKNVQQKKGQDVQEIQTSTKLQKMYFKKRGQDV